jgi:hypothetical protein
MHSLTAIEDAILDALKARPEAQRARLIAPYGGEIEPEKIKAVTAWPFLLVTFGGVAAVEDHGSRKIEATRWLVFAGDSHKADLARARRGMGGVGGTYSMLRAVQAALEGKQLLAGLLPAVRLGEETLVNEAGLSVIACHYEISQPYLV